MGPTDYSLSSYLLPLLNAWSTVHLLFAISYEIKTCPSCSFFFPTVTTPSLLPSSALCAADSSVGPDFDKNICAQALF